MATFNLLYATKVNLGGWATFTVHLYHLLEQAGHDVNLFKVGNRTEAFTRPFAGHGIKYRNMRDVDLMGLPHKGHTIIAALGKHYVHIANELMMRGAGIVVHDTAESTNRMDVMSPWVIRKELVPLFDRARFIRHPYVRHGDMLKAADLSPKKRKGFFATSRVDFDKNTTMILDANRLGANIDIVGFENRLYTRFKVCPEYPEWEQSKGNHPRSGQGSFDLLTDARGMVDLTDIKGDGGGTQYTFLEAWDAGAVPIIGSWWERKGDDMRNGTNCFTVGSAEELKSLVTRWPSTAGDVAKAGQARIARYHGKSLVPEIIDWLENL